MKSEVPFKIFSYLTHISLSFRISIFLSSYFVTKSKRDWTLSFLVFFSHQGKQVPDSLWKVWNTIFRLWEILGYSPGNSIWPISSFQPSLLTQLIFAPLITCLILISKEQHSIFMIIWNLVNNYIILSTKPLFKCLGYLLALFFTWDTGGKKKQLFLPQKCDLRSRTLQDYS